MTCLVVASAKGRPGVTTAALALGASWPGARPAPIVAELDPAGGDVAARFDLSPQPGLVSLAAAARRGLAPSTVAAHCQSLPGGLPVLLGPASATRAATALRLLQPERLVAALDGPAGVDLVIDAGRLDPRGALLPVLGRATATLLLVRPIAADVLHLAALIEEVKRIEELRAVVSRMRLVVVGSGPFSEQEVAATLGLELAGVLPIDRDGAAMLAGRSGSARALARSPLARAARAIVGRVLNVTAPTVVVAEDVRHGAPAPAMESTT